MHVAIIIDEERLGREQIMLHRLCVGLVGEGHRVTRIVPEEFHAAHIAQGEHRISLVPHLETQLSVLPWQHTQRTGLLASSLDKPPPDIIYAIGRHTWEVARELAEGFDCPWMLEVCAEHLLKRLPGGRKSERIAAYIAPTAPLATMLRRHVDPGLIKVVPMGVKCRSDAPDKTTRDEQTPFLALLGPGRDLEAYRAGLEAISKMRGDHPDLGLILELRGPQQHQIWNEARRLNLLDMTSPIGEAAPNRALLSRCHILALPEATGEASSIPLEAMAGGALVLSARDSVQDALIDDETATLIDTKDANAWAHALGRLMNEPATASRIRDHARQHVLRHHGLSRQLEAFTDLLDQAVTGGTLTFPRGNG